MLTAIDAYYTRSWANQENFMHVSVGVGGDYLPWLEVDLSNWFNMWCIAWGQYHLFWNFSIVNTRLIDQVGQWNYFHVRLFVFIRFWALMFFIRTSKLFSISRRFISRTDVAWWWSSLLTIIRRDNQLQFWSIHWNHRLFSKHISTMHNTLWY